jgi:hypothetical protein
MQIKRKVFLSLLEQVMPVISAKSLAEHQKLNFYRNRLQATNGNVWIDIETGFELNIQVQAEPLYLLIKKLRAKDINLEIKEGVLLVSAKNVEGEYSIKEPVFEEVPAIEGSVGVEEVKDFIDALKFCSLGASKDETHGVLCGVAIKDNLVWGCDRFRILNWHLAKSTGLDCCLPAKLAVLLDRFKDEVKAITFGEGCLGVDIGDSNTIWASVIQGEYEDLSRFFPETEAETIKLSEDFPEILDRHLGNQKDVANDEKEINFTVGQESIGIASHKYVAAEGFVERKLEDALGLEEARAGNIIEFGVNPVLLKDIIGLSLSFKYFQEDGIVLFETDKFKYVILAR